jgi:hypothetical protein
MIISLSILYYIDKKELFILVVAIETKKGLWTARVDAIIKNTMARKEAFSSKFYII